MARARRKPAAKPAGAVLRDFDQQLEAGWPAGLTVLAGDDLYHLDQVQRRLLDALVPAEATDFGLTVYADDKVKVSEVVAAARSVGMFAPRRVVLVRDVGVLDGEPDALIDYAKAPPPSSYIVVRALQLDQRFKLHKALAKSGNLLRLEQGGQDLRSAMQALKGLADRKKVKLTREALAWVAEACGGDLYRATNELDKLAAWQGTTADGKPPAEPVELETVRALVIGNERLTGWEVADAIMDRDPVKAVGTMRSLIAGGAEPLQMLGGIAWRARVMVEAKALLARRTPPREVISATRAWNHGDRLLAGLRRYSMDELLRFPDLLRTADRALKGGLVPGGAVMEELVERMTTNPLRPPLRAR